jgi:hypothetical protein
MSQVLEQEVVFMSFLSFFSGRTSKVHDQEVALINLPGQELDSSCLTPT